MFHQFNDFLLKPRDRLFRNISLLLFLKSFKKAERHSNKTTDLSWLINCARVFADEGRQVALSLVVYEDTGLCQ